MASVEDYVARIEETCGEEKDFIVIFKYDKKNEAVAKMLQRARREKSVSTLIYELTFGNVSFRLYSTGKAIFRNLKERGELQRVLAELLL